MKVIYGGKAYEFISDGDNFICELSPSKLFSKDVILIGRPEELSKYKKHKRDYLFGKILTELLRHYDLSFQYDPSSENPFKLDLMGQTSEHSSLENMIIYALLQIKRS